MLNFKKRGLNYYKKGISPLIASVLLVGFVVSVGVIIIFWGRDFVREKAQKEGALAEKQLKCENIEIDVKSVDKTNKFIEIENKGNEDIDGFILRVVSGGTGADKITQKVSTLELAKISYSFNLGSKAKIDLIPSLRPEGTSAPLVPCSSKHKVINIE